MLGRCMLFAVRHETRYRYSLPVVLAPHVLRLTPRPEHRLLSRTLVVRPEPLELNQEVDAFGNATTRVVFPAASTEELFIDSTFELETTRPGPALASGPEAARWPPVIGDALAPYLARGTSIDAGVAAFGRALLAEAGHDLLPFLDHLCRTVHSRADKRIRPTGDAQSAAETLATWRGACRDFTVLFLAVVRSLGLAARFCSGYQAEAETPDGRSYLHAWPEVFVPGIGWRGWDPTHGIPVSDGHVALCAAPEQVDTMPVVGSYSFNGQSLTSTLDFNLRITTT
jgi:transglutaminase-like putative cysteine protease